MSDSSERESATEGRRGPIPESAREILVVVASILIAFSLDAWWDGAQDRRDERELLTNLLEEFRANREQLELRVRQHERLAAGSAVLSGRLESVTGSATEVPDSLLITLMITPTFDPRLGTLDEAQSSGRTSLIRNDELRRRLSSWYGLWRDVREEEQLSLELVQRELFPAVVRTVPLTHLVDEGGAWLAGRPSPELRGGRTGVPVTPALTNFAALRSVRSRRAALELNDLSEELDAIIDLLARETDEG